ncbi:MAG: hypothetical protein NW224_20000 [Leptolyngbyaceae cyanobacterium bins.302]|nr:hypothetical protein [Leptolyngbyaceae cyanobacterium bins.302]
MNIWKRLQSPSFPPIFTWEYLLSSLLMAIVLARGVAALCDSLIPQKYSQLIVGNITWDAGSKHPDYFILFGFVGFFFAIHLGLQRLASNIMQVNGAAAELGFRDVLIYALLPLGVWIGNIFVNSKPSLEFVILSAVLTLLAIVFAAGTLRKKYQFSLSDTYNSCVSSNLLIILFAALSGNALMLAMSRLNLNWQLTETQSILGSGLTVLVFGLGLLILWTWKKLSLETLQRRLRVLLGLAQGFLPLCFLILIPAPWVVGERRFLGYGISPILIGLLVVLIGVTYVDIFRRVRSQKVEENFSLFSVISPLCLIALLIYLKSPVVGVGFILFDDYHGGESLLPWWLTKTFGYIPFIDYEPARGLVNYVPGLLTSLLFDGKFASYAAVKSTAPQFLPYFAIAFPVLAQSVGALPAFLCLVLVPNPNNLYEIDLMITVGVCILAEFFLKRKPVSWLGLWLVACVGLILFAPGQGGLFTISTFPLAIFVFYKAIREQQRYLLRGTIFAGITTLVIAFFTPLGQMLFGALRYGVEQSSLNSVAYGAEWFKSVGTNPFQTYPLWEFIRTCWIIVTIAIGLLIYQTIAHQKIAERQRFLAFAIPFFLLTLLIIPRAAGRIDGGTLSRLGIASAWAMGLVLPVILLSFFERRAKPLILIIVAILSSLLSSGLTEVLPNLERLATHPSQSIYVGGVNFTNGTQTGLLNLDQAVLDPEHLRRLQRLNALITTLLEPGETYLDLTYSNARYAYFNYPPPIPANAYNLVHKNQQLRTIQQVEARSIPLVVVLADPAFFFEPLALRTPLLYRYTVEHYIPFQVDEFVFMIHPDRRDRLERLNNQLSTEFASGVLIGDREPLQLSLLDRAFRVRTVEAVPSSWGRSLNSLQSSLRFVQDLSNLKPTLTDVEQVGGDRYRMTGANPRLTFDIASLNLNGWDTGLLLFDFNCKGRSKGSFTIRWDSQSNSSSDNAIQLTPYNGKQITPMDAAPRWLLAKGLQTITFEPKVDSCSEFSLTNLQLYQRADIANN